MSWQIIVITAPSNVITCTGVMPTLIALVQVDVRVSPSFSAMKTQKFQGTIAMPSSQSQGGLNDFHSHLFLDLTQCHRVTDIAGPVGKR